MEGTRLRLVFKDGGLLSNTQESQGLNKTWLLLQPHHHHQLQTIASLSAYIILKFQLQQSCPDGILLYMDDFVLPPFESINILTDKDIVRVEKKGGGLCIEGDQGTDEVEEMQIVEKQPVNTGVLLLANKEFDKETGGYQSEESEEDDEDNNSEDSEHLEGGNTNSKKRKASEKFQGPLYKKQRSEPPRSIENEDHPRKSFNGRLSRKKGVDEEKLSKHEKATRIEINAKMAENTDGHVDATPSLKRNEQLQETDKDIDGATQAKRPGRSARRKYAKRRLLKMAKAQQNNLDSQPKEVKNWKHAHPKAKKREEVGTSNTKGLLDCDQFGEKGMPKTWSKNEEDNQTSIACEKPIQNGGGENELVAVMIRPGHIRFEPREEDQPAKNDSVDADQPAQNDRVDSDQPVQNDRVDSYQIGQQNQLSVESFRWNGISSKKKGQKWGIEKSSISQKNDYRESRRYDMNSKKDTYPVESVDFDKLPLLPGVPKEGDVVAYRLLELSSSWTPELSSYRVGEVSQYNSESCKIILIPVPEFPFVSDESNEDESAPVPDNPLYKEDGSLETDFSSLVDVRVIRCGELDLGTAGSVPEKANEGPLSNENSVTLMLPSSNNNQLTTPVSENGESNHRKSTDASSTGNGVNLWEEISEALNAKKAELSKANGSGKSSWSHRTLKGSALGPTMDLLRSEKQDNK